MEDDTTTKEILTISEELGIKMEIETITIPVEKGISIESIRVAIEPNPIV